MIRWPWTRPGPAKDDVRALREELSDLRSDLKRIRAEWEDMFEKLVRRDDRIRKREERAQGERSEEQPSIPLVLDRKAALRARLRGGGA